MDRFYMYIFSFLHPPPPFFLFPSKPFPPSPTPSLLMFKEQDNQQYLAMVHRVLSTHGFYISHTYDLTHSLQRKHHLMRTKPNFLQLPLHERADERFIWNSHLLRDLVVQPELRRFIVPMIHGFVAIKTCSINGKPFVFALISRRSAHRAGKEGVVKCVL